MKTFLRNGILFGVLLLTTSMTYADFSVTATSPTMNALHVATNANITITFSEDVNFANIADNTNLIITGSMSGRHSFTKSYNGGTFTVTADPDNDFLPGEIVTFKILYDIQNAANTTSLGVSKQYSFTVAAGNTGEGYFTTSQSFTGTPAGQASKIYAVDFDKDGDVDIVSFRSTDYVDLTRKNNSLESYSSQTAMQFSGGYNLNSLAFSDINRDQYIDVAVFHAVGGTDITTSSIIINNYGTLNPPSSTIHTNGTFNTTNNTGGLIADVNMDGYDDFIVINKGLTGAVPFYSSGGSSFSQGNSTLLANTTTGSWVTADLNNDGYPDFVGVSGPSDDVNKDTVGVILSTGSNAYAAKTVYITGTGNSILGVAVGDLDGDGDVDIVAVDNSYSNNCTVFKNNGSGVFSTQATTSLADRAKGLKVADMDGDGDLDLVYYSSTNVYVSFNNGSGTFDNHATYTLGSGMTTFTDLAVCDADGDGDLDVVLNDPNNTLFRVYKNSVVTAPTSAGGTPIFNYNYGDSVTITLSNGSGAKRLIVLKQGSAVDAAPSDNATYTANSAFGSGTDLGGGNYVVYNGTNSSYYNIPVSNLSYGSTYYIAVFEYNGPSGLEKYKTTGNATGSGTTATTPNSATVNAFSKNYGSSVQVNWTKGGGKGRIVVMKQGSAVNVTPTNSTTYTASATFGSGSDLGGGNYVVFNGNNSSDNFVNVTGLSTSTIYHVAVFEYFGNAGSEIYGSTESEGNPIGLGNVTTNATNGYPFDTTAGYALNFDGRWNQTNNSFSIEDSFTVELWAKPSSIGSDMVILDHGNDKMWIGINAAGHFTALLWDDDVSSDITITGTATAVANQWYHLALTGKTGAPLKLYVNGVLDASSGANIGLVYLSSDVFYPGGDYNTASYTGLIDELRLWSSVRTAEEIRTNMHKTLSGTPANLLGYWQFNEGSGNASDEVVNDNTMVNYDNLLWATSDVPVGGGTATSASVTANTTGLQTIGNVKLDMTDGFDDPTDVVISEVTAAPNSFPTNYSSSVGNKYFIIDAFPYPGNGTFSATLTLSYGSGVLTDANASNYILYKRSTTSTGTWTSYGAASSVNTTTGDVTWTGITSFSQAIVVNQNEALPVELTSFSAKPGTGTVELHWKTATEVNNAGFEVERSEVDVTSSDLNNWKKIGSVEGSGTSNTPHEYSFIDESVRGSMRYRLKQIDRDGKSAYSNIVEVTVNAPMVFSLNQNYPNPFNPSTTIQFTIAQDGPTTLKVFNSIGQEVATLVNEYLKTGEYHQAVFNATNLASGIYFVQLRSSNLMQLKKMMLLK